MVGKEVADKLRPLGQPEGLEAVARFPMAQREGLTECGGIEEGLVGGKMAEVDLRSRGLQGFHTEGGHGVVGLGTERLDEELAAVEEGLMGGGQEAAPRRAALEYVGHIGCVEPIGAQQLEEELAAQGTARVGLQGCKGVKTKADTDGAVGLWVYQLAPEGGEEGRVELLDVLQIGDGGGQGRVGGGLELAQEGDEAMAHLVAPVEEGCVGGVFDMGEPLPQSIVLNLGPAERKQRPHNGALDRQDAVEA